MKKIAIIDIDVHHGNGTQQAFEESPDIFFLSIHQDNCYPPASGPITDNGKGDGIGYNINVPLPPGTGSGGYKAAFNRIVTPALQKFSPDFILVSCGFDAGGMDPLARMMLTSEDFSWMIAQLKTAAQSLCHGRLFCVHEGGYSIVAVPFCGLRVMEALTGHTTNIVDPYSNVISGMSYHDLQSHQKAVIDAAVALLDNINS
eukprot:TRINITY_DN8281_c0_g1_i1.p1 TRINITY_DN8281_c0_g1~~TRINITY_DN8281_c0_g1_i1.p1  ORF type:complete len:213 (-),score=40.81 TRINITY_DN8281_c0_g1_i1:84-689(-)